MLVDEVYCTKSGVLESPPNGGNGLYSRHTMHSRTKYNWSRKSLDELEKFYWNTIAVDMRRAGLNPDTNPPSYEWLVEHGYSGLAYTLREHHDLTLREFFVDVAGVEAGSSDGYPWGIDAETTIREVESYLSTLERRKGLKETTIESKQTRLATYARVYAELHGQANLIERVTSADTRTEEITRALAVFDELDESLSSDESKIRYLTDVNQFYEHLRRRGKAAYNPVENFREEYGWQRSEPDNAGLDAHQVRAIYREADGADELLVLALCAWGLRRNEVASLHHRQLVLEGDDPHIAFDDRKNGPGTVALIYGLDAVEERLVTLSDDEWNGYLFPSARSTSGHIAPETVNNRFHRLAERAGVRVRGEIPTSKVGRRFWYLTYLESVEQLVDQLGFIADEQGSADATVVADNYLSEAKRRQYRREFMRERLAAAFGGEHAV